MKYYTAHWGVSLTIVSVLFTCALFYGGFAGFAHEGGLTPSQGIACLGLVLGCALFTICGYTVTPDAILIHRPFWSTHLSRDGLRSATFEPRAMRWSIRAGNGGVFSITGLFWNKSLGLYRAFVTDGRQTVVLRYTGRTVVVSPSSPEEFVQALVPTQATSRSVGL
jgi:hypothetical protein